MTEQLDRTVIAQIARRIRERLRLLKLTPRAASVATERGPDVIRNLLRAADAGKPYNPREDTLDAIAEVLKVSAAWLRYGDLKQDDGKVKLDPMLHYIGDAPDFIGIVETEAFKWVFSADEDLGFHPPIGADPRYVKCKQGIWLVRGDGAARSGILSGMYVSAAMYDDYAENIGPISHGMHVIVERTKDDGVYVETSIREYQIWPDRIEFVARSSSKDHPPITLPLGWSPSEYPVEIKAVISGAHILFENEGFLPHYY